MSHYELHPYIKSLIMNLFPPIPPENSKQSQKQHSNDLQAASPKTTGRSMDPFNHNYTLTGLVNHIQTTIGELISMKKHPEGKAQDEQSLEMSRLVKIQQEVEVLKNIIVYNLNEIFSVMYPSSCQNKVEPKTDIPPRSTKEDQKDESLDISDFDGETEGGKMGKINTFQVKRDGLHFYNSYCSGDTCGSETKDEDWSEHPKRKIEIKRDSQAITPFQLPHQNNCNIRVEDQDSQDCDDGFDLICYEDQKSIEGYRGIKVRQPEEKEFSPIEERAAWEEETDEKVLNSFTLNQFTNQSRPSEPSRDITKRLFSYTSVVLPRKMRRKKFNYLQQVSMRR